MKKPLSPESLDGLSQEAISNIYQAMQVPLAMYAGVEVKGQQLETVEATRHSRKAISELYSKLADSYLNYRLEREEESTLLELYTFAGKALGEKQAKQVIRKLESIVDDGIAATVGRDR